MIEAMNESDDWFVVFYADSHGEPEKWRPPHSISMNITNCEMFDDDGGNSVFAAMKYHDYLDPK